MKIVTLNGRETIYLNEDEYRAYEIISLGRDLGLPPRDTLQELRANNLKGDAIRSGQKAYLKHKKGANVYQGKGPEVKLPGYYSMSKHGLLKDKY